MSQGIRLFFYVWSGHSVLHIMFGSTHSEGLTACGRVVSKGWKWFKRAGRSEHVCKQCLKHA